jgi:DNA-binding MarR family transcriptional regulator
MNALINQGIVRRHNDPLDGRRSFVSLTEDGFARMSNYFEQLPAGTKPL